MPRKKIKKQGGKRKGAGRPCADTVGMWVTVSRETATKLTRFAKSIGLVKRLGGPPFIGSVIDRLAAPLEVQEPEYLRLARELGENKC